MMFFLCYLLLTAVVSGVQGLFVMQIEVGHNTGIYEDRNCIGPFIVTQSIGRVVIRRPTFLSPETCHCLVYLNSNESWPQNGEVDVIYHSQGDEISWRTFTQGYFDDRNNLQYNEAVPFSYEIDGNDPRLDLHFDGTIDHRFINGDKIFTFFAYDVEVGLSCSPDGYIDPRTTLSTSVTRTSNPDSTAKTPTTSEMSHKGSDSNTNDIIMGVVVAGSILIVAIVVIIVVLLRKSHFRNPKQKNETICQEEHEHNREEPPVTYVNVETANQETTNIEYAQVDIGLLARKPTPSQDNNNVDTDTEKPALTYADLDFNVNLKETEKVIVEDTENPSQSSDVADISELYAKPIKKPKPAVS